MGYCSLELTLFIEYRVKSALSIKGSILGSKICCDLYLIIPNVELEGKTLFSILDSIREV